MKKHHGQDDLCDLKICHDRVVPDDHSVVHPVIHRMREDAILHATSKGSVRDAFRELDATADVLPAPHLALIIGKAWPAGSRLRCRFLDGTPVQRARVVAKAKIWERYANVHIDFVDHGVRDEQIRIAFRPGQGSWSAIGRDALSAYFPHGEPTMNFGWLVDDTEDEEWERVVVHEFGHALGCLHEHQSPTEELHWNEEAVLRVFSGPPNCWDEATIRSNILERYSPRGIHATIFDRDSIMLYEFPADLFKDGVATPQNAKLSARDKTLIRQMYPGF